MTLIQTSSASSSCPTLLCLLTLVHSSIAADKCSCHSLECSTWHRGVHLKGSQAGSHCSTSNAGDDVISRKRITHDTTLCKHTLLEVCYGFTISYAHLYMVINTRHSWHCEMMLSIVCMLLERSLSRSPAGVGEHAMQHQLTGHSTFARVAVPTAKQPFQVAARPLKPATMHHISYSRGSQLQAAGPDSLKARTALPSAMTSLCRSRGALSSQASPGRERHQNRVWPS